MSLGDGNNVATATGLRAFVVLPKGVLVVSPTAGGCVGGPLVQVGGYSNRGVAAVHTQAFRCFASGIVLRTLRVKPASDTGRGN